MLFLVFGTLFVRRCKRSTIQELRPALFHSKQVSAAGTHLYSRLYAAASNLRYKSCDLRCFIRNRCQQRERTSVAACTPLHMIYRCKSCDLRCFSLKQVSQRERTSVATCTPLQRDLFYATCSAKRVYNIHSFPKDSPVLCIFSLFSAFI